ncbi:MAG: DUF6671 family protein [Bacteroidota bacterium]
MELKKESRSEGVRNSTLFSGRTLLIATKHAKEKAISGILEMQFGVLCQATQDLDTDLLGTFTGEVERTFTPIETARRKCSMALESTGLDLAIASEGSFGAHPTYFFLPADEELLLLVDRKHDLEIVARVLSTDTNFNSSEISTLDELKDFATVAKFPSHALILRGGSAHASLIQKGITDWNDLSRKFVQLVGTSGVVRVETDMRACFNPTRMEVIRKATLKLAEKLNSCCPGCELPGFSITEAMKGLPCIECGFPTRSIKSSVFRCDYCGYVSEMKFPDGKESEDPMYCDRCNP